ncbi:MAG: Lrp/AsnC family transcriptional regulator [Methanomicrobiales archaeon HGW-Methanomicrobiales-1]|jgi:DNA-binding Lrp family transcriptional regulator|nr:MAG: Lrp/AsnC family transcriptional regulator [Methanomicrobiales archaeon HGW-Methanomicrobiales-1]
MDQTDRTLLKELENGLPLVSEPFGELGERLQISGTEVMERLRRLKENGIIRKFRARINQRQIGITANAVVAWQIPDASSPELHSQFASFPGVSHCYLRQPVPGRWDYTLYTVHHGRSRTRVLTEVILLAGKTGISNFVVLFSTEEFKRIPAVRISVTGGEFP